MKKISSETHGIIDYSTVVFLLLSPVIFDMEGIVRIFTYALGIVHLLLTLSTDFEAGVIRIVPLKIHGIIELVVAIALVAVSGWFMHSGKYFAAWFYLLFAAMLFIVWSMTDYRSEYK